MTKIRQKIQYILLGVIMATGGIALYSVADNRVTTIQEKLGELTQVFAIIKRNYVDDVDDEKLLDGAIVGMISKLDPHSAFLPPKQHKNIQTSIKGEFGGLGIEVSLSSEGYVLVVSPIDDTPAYRAGIKAGDLIVKLDGDPVKGKSLGEAVQLMRGKRGEKIVLSILREGEDKLIEKEIIRDIIQIQSVRSRIIQPNYGYLRVSRFQARTGLQLATKIDELVKKEQSMKGVILDLRNNPGGLLSAAVEVAGTFMNGGKVVYTKGRIAGSDKEYFAESGEKLEGLPIVLLINEGSASASEIVAGALQDNKRAIIVGRKSFGKGSVQSIIELRNSNSALKLTTAKYYTPKGRTIQAEGITPDIEIPKLKIELLKNTASGIKEKDLPRHLENEKQSTSSQAVAESEKKKEDYLLDNELLKTDYELYMALNILKGSAAPTPSN